MCESHLWNATPTGKEGTGAAAAVATLSDVGSTTYNQLAWW